jgi:hypothetical protein
MLEPHPDVPPEDFEEQPEGVWRRRWCPIAFAGLFLPTFVAISLVFGWGVLEKLFGSDFVFGTSMDIRRMPILFCAALIPVGGMVTAVAIAHRIAPKARRVPVAIGLALVTIPASVVIGFGACGLLVRMR